MILKVLWSDALTQVQRSLLYSSVSVCFVPNVKYTTPGLALKPCGHAHWRDSAPGAYVSTVNGTVLFNVYDRSAWLRYSIWSGRFIYTPQHIYSEKRGRTVK